MRSELRAADALVFSSSTEALPMAGIEALSEGLPVVTTDAGDAGLLAVDEHLLCPPRDPRALAERLLWLLERSPQQRAQLRRQAWQLCGERFGIERTVARYRSIYRDLVGVA